MFTMINQFLFFVYLIVLSVMDIRRKEVHIYALLAGMIFVILRLIFGNIGILPMLITGVTIGSFFLFISKVSSESFGYGDSILITIMGLFLELWEALNILLLAFGLAAVYSMIILILRKYERRYAFPFIPFLAIAYAGVMVF